MPLSEEDAFARLGLDLRVCQALSQMKWTQPSLIQAEAVPLALKGKDILARARTGSGKTGAYSLPIAHKLLTLLDKQAAGQVKERPLALVLVPTRELCDQVADHFTALAQFSGQKLTVLALGADVPLPVQKPLLAAGPAIVVSTPARVTAHLDAENIVLDHLHALVIDEADLVLSYGYEDDLRQVIRQLPNTCQSFLMSATLSDQLQDLRKLVLRSPAILKLEASAQGPGQGALSQYSIQCVEKDKFLLMYALLKLEIIKGKTLIFVNSVERCFRLKLFLEQFSVKSVVLNSELPQKSRDHILRQFNRDLYTYMIATDESLRGADEDGSDGEAEDGGEHENKEEVEVEAEAEEEEEEKDAEEEEAEEEEGTGDAGSKNSKKNKADVAVSKDNEYGVARGVDFRGVATVINFDFPTASRSYVHRVGRTARGGAAGTAVSFVTADDAALLARVQRRLRDDQDLGDTDQAVVKEFPFNHRSLNRFRYRVEDTMRAVTRHAVKEARLKELKQEILHSEKLQGHFEDNPRDLLALKHDKPLHVRAPAPHLASVPSYLHPASNGAGGAGAGALVPSALEEKLAAEAAAAAAGSSGSDAKHRLNAVQAMAARKRRARSDPLLSYSSALNSDATRAGQAPAGKKRKIDKSASLRKQWKQARGLRTRSRKVAGQYK